MSIRNSNICATYMIKFGVSLIESILKTNFLCDKIEIIIITSEIS